MNTFMLCFVPLFVAVDAIGLLPVYMALTEGVPRDHLRKVVLQSVITATTVALAFLAFGPSLLRYLGITVSDFMIAGGILLLSISLGDLLTGTKAQRSPDAESLGVVPLGVPLIAGPAVLTTCLLLSGLHGMAITALAVIANTAFAGVVFVFADPIAQALGRTGSKVVSKFASMLLTAIAVMLIRRGVMDFAMQLKG